ncbi:MAG TPA: hypothetical protein VGX03_38370, partial [Candidatus Binatia bacterium]|nr:hypothetical protein [Candidatus Binatia bacterium]
MATEKRWLISLVVVVGALGVWPRWAAGKSAETASLRPDDPPAVQYVSLAPAAAVGFETAKFTWTRVATGGFGNPGNILVRSLEVFAGRLYAITFNFNGGEVYRSVTTNPLTWE